MNNNTNNSEGDGLGCFLLCLGLAIIILSIGGCEYMVAKARNLNRQSIKIEDNTVIKYDE